MKTESPPYDCRCTHATAHLITRSGKTRKIHQSHSSRPGRVRSGQTRSGQTGSGQTRPGQFLMLGSTLNVSLCSSLSYSLSLILYTTTPGNVLLVPHVYRYTILIHVLTISQRSSLTFTPRTIVSHITFTLKTADGSAAIYMVPSSCTNTSSRNR